MQTFFQRITENPDIPATAKVTSDRMIQLLSDGWELRHVVTTTHRQVGPPGQPVTSQIHYILTRTAK